MSQSATAEVDWRRLAAQTGLYPAEAFQFVRDGLNRTSELVHGPGGPGDADRHVSGQQLCMGLRDYAIERYGMLALSVLSGWNGAGTLLGLPYDSLDGGRVPGEGATW